MNPRQIRFDARVATQGCWYFPCGTQSGSVKPRRIAQSWHFVEMRRHWSVAMACGIMSTLISLDVSRCIEVRRNMMLYSIIEYVYNIPRCLSRALP